MDLSNLQPAVGSNKKGKRIGRGAGSGKGGTSTRGHKGAKSRSGYSAKVGFEGVQIALLRRGLKFGFKSHFIVEYKAVNLDVIQEVAEAGNLTKVSVADLVAAGKVRNNQLVKVLANGELTAKLEVEAHAISKKAEEAITAAGGTFQKI